MKRNPKPPKASTASSADNITLDVPTPAITGKANGNGKQISQKWQQWFY